MAKVGLIYLDDYADEGGNFPIDVTLTDEDGASDGVTALRWRLTDKDGTVLNGRANVSETPTSPSTRILLEGDDLECSDGFTGMSELRHVGVKITYNSSLGTDKIQTAECVFKLKNSKALPFPA